MCALSVAWTARAAPILSVLADSECPSQGQLEEALVARGFTIGSSSYVVTTHTRAPGVLMQLVHGGVQPVLTREFENDDCRAVADATAVVVEAHFLQVADSWPQAGARAPGDTLAGPSGAPLAVPGAAPNSSAHSPTPVTQAAAPARTASAAGGAVRELPPAPRAARSPGVIIGAIGIGPSLEFPDLTSVLRLEAQAGIEFPSLPFSSEVQAAVLLPRVTGEEPNRVRRWSSQGLIRLGLPFGARARYRPWLGAGVSLAQMRAIDLANPETKSSAAALVAVGFEFAWPAALGWAGRLDLSCTLLTLRDAYRVQPDGEIGSGPRIMCGPTLGLRLGASSSAAAPPARPGTPAGPR